MNKMTLWSVLASLLCSLAVSDGVIQVGHDVQLAAMGNPAAVRSLAAVVTRMAGSDPAVAPAPAATKVLVTPASLKQDDELIALGNWTRTAEHRVAMSLDGPLAAVLGLGRQELPMTQFCMSNRDRTLSAAINVGRYRGVDFWIFQLARNGVSVLWRVDRDGKVIAVARADGQATALPIDAEREDLARTRATLIRRMQRDMPRSVAGADARAKS